jgi:hypothetical protein
MAPHYQFHDYRISAAELRMIPIKIKSPKVSTCEVPPSQTINEMNDLVY